ncbi:MAG: hypothetical protein HUJ98_11305, partial [Bacteroidaceae bacterium]|nr:hypothetical protein [Bacteroidaceae bacterium]
MKKLILFIAATLWMAAVCAETKQALTLHCNDGGKIVYLLDNQPLVSFSGQQMVVATADGKASLPMENIHHWEIGLADVSAAEQVDAEQVVVTVDADAVNVLNPEGAQIAVYALSGRQVATSAAIEA